ncbi:MAG: methyltransferase domain-containing protein [Caldiserica bacterium]|nr:methyltransferase domain-containing protein [Caldisericota bacterium]
MSDDALFDSKADTYDSWYMTPLGAYEDELENALVFRHVGVVRGKTVLDVGCGTGLYSIRLSEGGADVTAVDISPKMIEIARRKAQDRGQYIWYDQADMIKLPYENRTFDMVVSIAALEFSADPLLALMEMARVLRPGGKLVVGVLNADSPWADARREHAKREESIYGAAHFLSSSDLRMLFHRTGTFGALTMESCLYTLPDEDESNDSAAARQEFFGRMFKPLTGAFLVGTARKR